MDEARFEDYFLDSTRWVLKAYELKLAGDALTRQTAERVKASLAHAPWRAPHRQNPDLKALRELSALSNARALLYGLAIENAVKARMVRQGDVRVEHGNAKGLPTHHNVLEMIKKVGYSPKDDQEEDFLQSLSYQTITLGKYPLAKNLKQQRMFSGRAVGARPEDANVVHRIIVSVLADRDLVELFENALGDE